MAILLANTMSWQSALLAKANPDSRLASTRIPSRILPRLFISDIFTARNPDDLQRLGITHILSLVSFAPVFPDTAVSIRKRFHVAIEDDPAVDILQHFSTTTEFIRVALAEAPDTTVLVRISLIRP